MFPYTSKSLFTAIFVFALSLFAKAQQIHFLYLQTESGQPFYVKVNNKIISSSAAGYLILPKLAGGDYKLSVGFPKKEFPEENFQVTIGRQNEGFLIKNFGDKGWGLFNMQSDNVIMGGSKDVVLNTPKTLQDDLFSKMLANVVKDSSILQKNEPVKPKPLINKTDSNLTATETIQPVINKTDSNGTAEVKNENDVNKTDSGTIISEKNIASFLSPATLLLSKKNKDGIEVIYIDKNEGRNDTIRIFIPSENIIVKGGNRDTSVVIRDTSNIVKDKSPIADSSSITISKPVPEATPDTTAEVAHELIENKDSVVLKRSEEKQPAAIKQDSMIKETNQNGDTAKFSMVVLPKVVTSSTINSDCRAFADNQDFFKLRKKLASEISVENMLKVAKKAFRSKCFSTEQIKNLSFLFLTNEGKYMFFDVAYAFASDSDQYHTLQSQLSDPYYVNRFKAMIHK